MNSFILQMQSKGYPTVIENKNFQTLIFLTLYWFLYPIYFILNLITLKEIVQPPEKVVGQSSGA